MDFNFLNLSERSKLCFGFVPLGCIALLVPMDASSQPRASASELARESCQSINSSPPSDGSSDIGFNGKMWRAISPDRVAYQLLSSSGRGTSLSAAKSQLKGLSQELDRFEGTAEQVADLLEIRDTANNFMDELAKKDSTLGILAFDKRGILVDESNFAQNELWFLRDDVIIRCKTEVNDPKTQPENRGGLFNSIISKSRLRGDTDALAAVGAARKKAKAAAIGLKRVRSFEDDGSRKETETITVNAVLGIPIVESRETEGLLAYVGYELNQNRVEPAPVLTPPATQRDNDTDVLKLGLIGHELIPLGGENRRYRTSANVTIDGSYLFDFVKDTERFRSAIAADFFHDFGSSGLCGLGEYRAYFSNKVWTLCELTARANFNILTDKGNLQNIAKETFGHVGGEASFKMSFGNNPGQGVFASANYMNLRRIEGDAAFIPHIRRHSFEIGNRWWDGNRIGFEAKVSLFDGINPDSFADENQLSIGFGIIF